MEYEITIHNECSPLPPLLYAYLQSATADLETAKHLIDFGWMHCVRYHRLIYY